MFAYRLTPIWQCHLVKDQDVKPRRFVTSSFIKKLSKKPSWFVPACPVATEWTHL